MSGIEVYVDLCQESVFAGMLYMHLRGGREGSSFRYDPAYIAHSYAYALEPAMPLSQGEFGFPNGLPRSFRDASPDRWGRQLINKGLRQQWRESGIAGRTITEVDYLLGTSDITRQGALRFRRTGESTFLATGTRVPKLITLPELLAASNKLLAQDWNHDSSDYSVIKILLEAGTGSLGGARPKSSVIEQDRQGSDALYLAKFPHPSDEWDVMRWEKIALDLAECAGITVPQSRLLDINGANVLVLKRFDRTDVGERIGYMSAMTLMDQEDGQAGDYVEIAEALGQISIDTSSDLSELWRRIVFSLAINNTDDHLRNHAFLREGKGWRLSPAFDLNPNPEVYADRVTAIAGASSFEGGCESISEVREWFGLSQSQAKKIQHDVYVAIDQWKTIARTYGATKSEITLFSPVFSRFQHS